MTKEILENLFDTKLEDIPEEELESLLIAIKKEYKKG